MKLEHAIRIDVPRGVVWSVTIDLVRWPEWTPTMSSVRRLDDEPVGVGTAAWIQ